MIEITIKAETMFELRTILRGLGGDLPPQENAVPATYLGPIKDHPVSTAPSDVEPPREKRKGKKAGPTGTDAPKEGSMDAQEAPAEAVATDEEIRNAARAASMDPAVGREKVLEVFGSIQPGATKIAEISTENRNRLLNALNALLAKDEI
jgi:hypothetical protein